MTLRRKIAMPHASPQELPVGHEESAEHSNGEDQLPPTEGAGYFGEPRAEEERRAPRRGAHEVSESLPPHLRVLAVR